ncbi:MAG: hypothetical protein K6F58_01215 [Bacteroidales bacterium]|nr:hypothetical protein [Bacteroidales bacterium]
MKFNLRTKLSLSLSLIGIVLLVSSIISVMEYRSMSSYVSDMIAENIHSVNVAQKLADQANEYNLAILALVGEESSVVLPDFDKAAFTARCDSLRASLSSNGIMPLADSVEYAYSAYMLTSFELQDVIASDFIDTRSWYFERLQPRYRRLRSDIAKLTEAIYVDLEDNSRTFESTFYRSIIPGIVAVGVGLLLLLMLLFFMTVYYVTPIYRMLDSLRLYRSHGTPFSYDFPGNDQLHCLNEEISELASENGILRKRISAMRRNSENSEK